MGSINANCSKCRELQEYIIRRADLAVRKKEGEGFRGDDNELRSEE